MKLTHVASSALCFLTLVACAQNSPVTIKDMEIHHSPRWTLDTAAGEQKNNSWSMRDVEHEGELYKQMVFVDDFSIYCNAPELGDCSAVEYDFPVPLSAPANEYYRQCSYSVRFTDANWTGFYEVNTLTGYRRPFNVTLHLDHSPFDTRLKTEVTLTWVATNTPSALRQRICNVPGHQDRAYYEFKTNVTPPVVRYAPDKPWPVELPEPLPGPPDLPPGTNYGQLYDSGCAVTSLEKKSSPEFGRRNCRKTVFLPEGLCQITDTNSGSFFTNLTCGIYAFCNQGLTYPGPDFGKYRESNTVRRIDESGIKGYLASFECLNVPTGKYLIEIN